VKSSSGSELAREVVTGETLNRFLWGSSMPRLSSSSLRSLKSSTKEAGMFVEEEEEEVEQREELRLLKSSMEVVVAVKKTFVGHFGQVLAVITGIIGIAIPGNGFPTHFMMLNLMVICGHFLVRWNRIIDISPIS
jgi:hypothetical protein